MSFLPETNELYDVVLKGESRVSDKFVRDQTEKLLKVIELKKLYRKGDYLFDTEKLQPHYNILEFAWSFCDYPPVANQIAESLEKRLEDIPDSETVNEEMERQFAKTILKRFFGTDKHLKPFKAVRDPDLVRFIWFAMNKVKNGDRTYIDVLSNLIDDLHKAKWEPADKFKKLLQRYL